MAPLAFLFPVPLPRSLSGPLPQPRDPLSPPGQRASDADRDTAVDILSAAAANGRLTLAELEKRVESALGRWALLQSLADAHGALPGQGRRRG